MIYHITTQAEWDSAQRQGNYAASSLETEGFIHCSTANQVVEIANAFYAKVPNLILLCVDKTRLKSPVKWEAPAHPEGHNPKTIEEEQLFPHVYGLINLEAVKNVITMLKDNDGLYQLPDGL